MQTQLDEMNLARLLERLKQTHGLGDLVGVLGLLCHLVDPPRTLDCADDVV